MSVSSDTQNSKTLVFSSSCFPCCTTNMHRKKMVTSSKHEPIPDPKPPSPTPEISKEEKLISDKPMLNNNIMVSRNQDNIAKKWKHLSGISNWSKLVDPLDADLRRYIIHYGERAQATYDAFNHQKESKYAGTSKFGKKEFFSEVGLEKGKPYKYRVTRFFYATSGVPCPDAFIFKPLSREGWAKESNWMGYVAVADGDETVKLMGRRDILVAWRGTIRGLEWVNDFQFDQVRADDILGHEDDRPKIHEGWHSIYTSENPKSPLNKNSSRTQVLTEVKRLIDEYKHEELSITVTGHSLGASMATLNAVDIVTSGTNRPSNNKPPILVTAFVFASPKVGNSNFEDVFNKYSSQLKCLRIRNTLDIVPKYPFVGYRDVGEELLINTRKSNYLKRPGELISWHNLEAYLHVVAGWRGDNDFKLQVKRDIALLNKEVALLKKEYAVPPQWWVSRNKGMMQLEDSSWVLKDYSTEDTQDFI